MLSMLQVPLPGEQGALMGFRWQYDHIARLVYDGIIDSALIRVRLASTNSGQIDDLLIDYHDRRAAYQFKGGVSKATITLAELTRSRKTSAGVPKDSLWKSLAKGWSMLRQEDENQLTVHLSMVALPSTSDHLGTGDIKPHPDHSLAFLARAVEPLREEERGLDSLPEWAGAIQQLEDESGLSKAEFRQFLLDVRLEFGKSDPLENASGTRLADITSLSSALSRLVSMSSGPVELSRDQILTEMQWHDRKSFRSIHEFPVNRSRYTPLTGGISALQYQLGRLEGGYIAVTGPPGSGKSTLLTQTLSGLSDRVVRYYAFVPGAGNTGRNRLSGEWFLHDLSAMLRDAGLSSRQKLLTPNSLTDLRQIVSEQMDAASSEFAATGRKTVVVVDGLDHVQRDYSGNDGLLGELPPPQHIPAGVIFVVGTRDLSPLSGAAKQLVEDAGTEISLEHLRLSRLAVLGICRSDTTVTAMTRAVHDLVADRSAGHPLALAYILNQLEDIGDQEPAAFVSALPGYDGDIAGQYRALWDLFEQHSEVIRVLRICSRLRIGFEMDWIRTWASEEAVYQLHSKLRFLFRVEQKRWHFFHDSFRQYARERTSIGANRGPDPDTNVRAHIEVAELCENSTIDAVRWEAIFHRSIARQFDAVLKLGTQSEFRRQFASLRSAVDIAEDARLVLASAAEQSDFPSILTALLALSEVQDKADEMGDIDVCNTLLQAGLVDTAIDYLGDERKLRVPLEQAYNLAANLGRGSNPAGLRIFEMIHHFGLEQPGSTRGINTDVNVARGWAKCAAHFLPIDIALSRARALLPPEQGDSEWALDTNYRLFAALIAELADELSFHAPDDLLTVDATVVEEIGALETFDVVPDRRQRLAALLGDLRYRVRAAHVESIPDFAVRSTRFAELDAELRGSPVFQSTLLDLAAQQSKYISREKAYETLRRTTYHEALSLDQLGATRNNDVVETRVHYWTLRHELEIGMGTFRGKSPLVPLDSLRAKPNIPAGNEVNPPAQIHKYSDAIELAGRIDEAVRTLGLVHALLEAGETIDEEAIWDALGGTLNLFPPFDRKGESWSSMHGLRSNRRELNELVIDALGSASPMLLDRYMDALARRFESQPEEWPASIQLELGLAFHEHDLEAPWLPDALQRFEAEAPDQGVNGALHDLAKLVGIFSSLGKMPEAARVASELASSSFGLGSRSDHQLRMWIEWFGRAAADLDESQLRSDSEWLARVLIAAEPLTDEHVGADDLPAAVAESSPALALELFEYLVGNGAFPHTAGMSNMLAALLNTSKLNSESIRLAAGLTGEIIAGAGNSASVELARALKSKASPTVLSSFSSAIRSNALPTTRSIWLQPGSKPSSFEPLLDAGDDEDYNGLELTNGTKYTRRYVMENAIDLIELEPLVAKEKAGSTFKWTKVLSRNFSGESVDQLKKIFEGSEQIGSVLLWLAETQLDSGDADLAAKLAREALPSLSLDSWTSSREGARRRAIKLLVQTGELSPGQAAMDFSDFVANERWYSYMIHTELDEMFNAMSHSAPPSAFWPVIREYLEGYAARLQLPPARATPKIAWWANDDVTPSRQVVNLDANGVIGELAAMHLTHPTWPVREGISRIIVPALRRGSSQVRDALARLIASTPSDDVLESIASCIAAAEIGDLPKDALSRELEALRAHPNLLVRQLAQPAADLPALKLDRPLAGSYGLVLPDHGLFDRDHLLGKKVQDLFPFEASYELLAEYTGYDLPAILAVAARYAREAGAALPGQDKVIAALKSSSMQLAYTPNALLASRSAFGRVLGDLVDAGLMSGLSGLDPTMLRTGDIRLVGRHRDIRPALVPAAPTAGHEQTTDRWLSDIDVRIEEYAAATVSGDQQLVGATSNLHVLNWPHVEEEFDAYLTPRGLNLRPERMTNARLRDLEWDGPANSINDLDGLLVRNTAPGFMERRSDWLAIHPVLSRALGWVPDDNQIGGWQDGGVFMAGTTDWNDGTWGRSGPMFDDTASEGFTTIVSVDALKTIETLVGPLDLVLILQRRDRNETQPPRTVTRRIQI
jgi:hypothetical protein